MAETSTPVAATTWVLGTVSATSYVPKSAKNSVAAWNGWHSQCSAPGGPTRTPILGNHWPIKWKLPK